MFDTGIFGSVKPRQASRQRLSRTTPREVSPPPKYYGEGVVNVNNFYSGANPRSAGRTLRRSNPTKMADLSSICALVEDHTFDMTPPKPRRLALAASRESQSTKKEFESYKRQMRNQVPSRTEELDSDPESDNLLKSILGDIGAIGGPSSRHAAARGIFHYALNNERSKPKL